MIIEDPSGHSRVWLNMDHRRGFSGLLSILGIEKFYPAEKVLKVLICSLGHDCDGRLCMLSGKKSWLDWDRGSTGFCGYRDL